MSTNLLSHIIPSCADIALQKQHEETGQMPSGRNGPWSDSETPVRNTAHWAITFSECYEVTSDERYRDAARRAVSYLESEAARPHGYTFHCRSVDNKDACNGLVGQAWAIEALSTMAQQFDIPRLYELAEEVFLLHPFDTHLCCWRPVEIDGQTLPYDMTFNHQLWFAAAGAMITEWPQADPRVDEQVSQFLDDLENTMSTYPNGLIRHVVSPNFDPVKYCKIFFDRLRAGNGLSTLKRGIGMFRGDSSEEVSEPDLDPKAIGYHSFNLYALALLKELYPDHPVWGTSEFRQALEFSTSGEFVELLDGNDYGYPYNCSGIKMAYVVDTFSIDQGAGPEEWLARQFERTYNPDSHRMDRNNPDPRTLTARMYEATRLPDLSVNV